MSENRKVALVTGSGKGIGRAVAIALAKKGIDIAVNYSRSEEAALKTAEMIRKEGGNAGSSERMFQRPKMYAPFSRRRRLPSVRFRFW